MMDANFKNNVPKSPHSTFRLKKTGIASDLKLSNKRNIGLFPYLLIIAFLSMIIISSGIASAKAEDSSIGGIRAVEKEGCIFLGSDFIEVGVLPNGGFGADVIAPESFFGFNRTVDDFYRQIGLYADIDGFYNETYDYRYDYFLPGIPEERWSIGFRRNGETYRASNGRKVSETELIQTRITNISNSTAGRVAVDSIFNSDLLINQTYELKPTDRFLKVYVKLTNVGSESMENVRYQRSFDPDNGRDVGCEPYTRNTIVKQLGPSKKAIVKAELQDADLKSNIGQISSIPIFYYTQAEEARVSIGDSSLYDSLVPFNPPYGDRDWNSAPAEGSSIEGDFYIALTFNKSVLAPGESVNYTYYIALCTDISETILDIEEEAGNPDPIPPQFNSTPEAFFIQNEGSFRTINSSFTYGYSGNNLSLFTRLDKSSITTVTANFSTLSGALTSEVPFEYQGNGSFSLLNYTLPENKAGIYPITVLANSSGLTNSTTCFLMLNFNPKTDIKGLNNPNTTDWTTIEDFTNVSKLSFEANASNGVLLGSLEFQESLNLCDLEFAKKFQNFNKFINFSPAEISLDSANLNRFNVSSKLTLRGLEFENQPGILLNEKPILCSGQQANDTVSGLLWDSNKGILVFEVEHWSTYTADGKAPKIISIQPVSELIGPDCFLNLNVSATDSHEVASVLVDVSAVNSTLENAVLRKEGNFWVNNSILVDASKEGLYNLKLKVTDLVGNCNSSQNCSVILDSTAPSVTVNSPGGELIGPGFFLDLNVSATDSHEVASVLVDVSAVNSTLENAVLRKEGAYWINNSIIADVSTNGLYNLKLKATDLVGNCNSSQNCSVILDSTAPLIEFESNGCETYAKKQSTKVTVFDSLSGILNLEYAWTKSSNKEAVETWKSFSSGDVLTKESGNGDWYLHVRTTDNAGNSNQSVSDVFKLDNIPPTYSWIQKVEAANTGETISIELKAKDESGISLHNISFEGKEAQMKLLSGNYIYNLTIPASDSGILVSSILYNCTFSDLAGNTNSTGPVPLNVSILPVADFSANVTRGVQPLGVTFTDNSSGLVEKWNWDFGDGNFSTEPNPTHLFDSGNYSVQLKVRNANGTSTKRLNIRATYEPIYTVSPAFSNPISKYGEELNFSVSTNLLSSYEWFIDGIPLSGPGVSLSNKNGNSSKVGFCSINSTQYISQEFKQQAFFIKEYNVSVSVKNESLRRPESFSWQWTVTNSSVNEGKDIDFVINKSPKIISSSGNEKLIQFNTSEDEKSDEEGLACSIKTVQFNTTNKTEGIQIKVEVLNKSSINESELDFSKASVYQYLDISFNNKPLVNEESKNRSIEFRVLNELKGGTLIVNTVYLKHRRTQKWESYKPELLGTDENYSYFIVRNISGFSPFAVICNYKYGSATSNLKENGDRGLPAYLKRLLFQKSVENIEQDSESEISEISASEKTAISENKAKSLDQEAEFNKKNINESREGRAQSADSNKLRGIEISLLFLIVVLFFLFRKKKDNDK